MFILVSAGATGSLLLGRDRGDHGENLESQRLETLIGLAVYLQVMTLAARLRVNSAGVHVAVLAAPVLIDRRALRRNRTGMDASRGDARRAMLAACPPVMIASSGNAPAARFDAGRRSPTSLAAPG